MTEEPERRGRVLAEFYRTLAPRLFDDLDESGLLPAAARAAARREWSCFALYACVRGLVAAGGFNLETGRAIEAFHEAVLKSPEALQGEPEGTVRSRIAERYGEYGRIGQEGGASGAATVTRRLGEAAARHMTAPHPAPEGLGEVAGSLHESLAEGSAEALRRGSLPWKSAASDAS